jgi:toxin HigB-1
MRIVYDDDGLRRLAEDSSFHIKKFDREVERGFRKVIGLLEAASNQQELRNFKALRLEKVDHDFPGCHSVRTSDKWRLIIEFRELGDTEAIAVIKLTNHYR